jgi:hypothetical protein
MNLNCLENFETDEKFETVAALTMKSSLFWVVAPFVAIQVTDVLEGHDLQSRCYSRGVGDLFSVPLRRGFNFLDTPPIDVESKAAGARNWPLIHSPSYIIKNAWTLMSIALILILGPTLIIIIIIIIIIISSIKPNVDIEIVAFLFVLEWS